MMPHNWRLLMHKRNSIFKCKQHTCTLHDICRILAETYQSVTLVNANPKRLAHKSKAIITRLGRHTSTFLNRPTTSTHTCQFVWVFGKVFVKEKQNRTTTSYNINKIYWYTQTHITRHCLPRHDEYNILLTNITLNVVWCQFKFCQVSDQHSYILLLYI